MHVPPEILLQVAKRVPKLKDRYIFAVTFRLLRIRDECLHELRKDITTACANGQVELLDWYAQQGPWRRLDVGAALRAACVNGQVKVLDWWKENGWRLLFQEREWVGNSQCYRVRGEMSKKVWEGINHAISSASQKRLFPVLEWWRESGLPTKDDWTFRASDATHTLDRDVITWWKSSSLKCSWYDPVCAAFDAGDLLFMIWLEQLVGSELHPNFFVWGTSRASFKGHVDLLEWWKNSAYVHDRVHDCILPNASSGGRMNVLEWWKGSNLLKNKNDLSPTVISWSIEEASHRGHVDVLEWWAKSALELGFAIPGDTSYIDRASLAGHVPVLRWFVSSGNVAIPLKWSKASMNHARSVKVLDWWKESGLECKWDAGRRPFSNATFEEFQTWKRWWKDFAGVEYSGP